MCFPFRFKAYQQLEGMINKMGDIERKLATEKEIGGYELYDEDIEVINFVLIATH